MIPQEKLDFLLAKDVVEEKTTKIEWSWRELSEELIGNNGSKTEKKREFSGKGPDEGEILG